MGRPTSLQHDVEVLFQTKSVAEVREVEATTQREIEDKKKQLRQVVGDSYRDLIASADTIKDIATQSQQVLGLIRGLQGGLSSLSSSAAERRGSGQDQEAHTSLDRLYAVGSRVKYLIETPEIIWGFLDARDHLEAARRFVRACEVHRVLSSRSRQITQRFPLLEHQWPTVRKFRTHVWDKACEWLLTHGASAPADQLAATVAAMALLKPVDGAELLKAFLGARQRCAAAALAAAADPSEGAMPAEALAAVAQLVCATVAQAGELFVALPGVTAVPAAIRALDADDVGADDLIFDPGSTTDDGGHEVAAWTAQRDAARERLAGLSAGGVALECGRWLEGLAADLKAPLGGVLARCVCGADLLAAETGVKNTIEGWLFRVAPDQTETGGNNGGPEAVGGAMVWSDVCQWVLGRPAPLWPLLEGPIVERAMALVSGDFTEAVSEATALLDAAVAAAVTLPPTAPGEFDPGSWSDVISLRPGTPSPFPAGAERKRRRTTMSRAASRADAGSKAKGPSPTALRSWVESADAVVMAFDRQLVAALDAALTAFHGDSASDTQQGVGRSAARVLTLQPFVQERCTEAADRVAAALRGHAEALGRGGGEDEDLGPAAARALVVGRVAMGIAERAAALRAILGPLEHWKAAADKAATEASAPRPALHRATSRVSASAAASAAAAAALSPRLGSIQKTLGDIAATAHGAWAAWAATGLSRRFLLDLEADVALSSTAPVRGWEEASLSAGGEDMKFLLPASPSPATARLALGACREADRAGGIAAEPSAVRLLKAGTLDAACAALDAALGPSGSLQGHVTDKGALQLLFDLRLMADLLGGGGAAVVRRRDVADLERRLSGLMDPIDWATYEQTLYSNEARWLGRCRVLTGAMTLGEAPRPVSAAATQPGAPLAETNLLRCAPAGPRFAYLPVNTPSALRHSKWMGSDSATGNLARVASSAALGGTDGAGDKAKESASDEHFSFAFVGGSRSRRAAEPAGRDAGVGGSGVGAAAFEALRQSKLGALLGDRAAGVAAGLGDYSLGATGLLSSLNLSTFNKK